MAPLWASYPELRVRHALVYVAGFLGASALAFSILLLEPSLVDTARVLEPRSARSSGASRLSRSGTGGYHARGVDLSVPHRVVQVLVVAAAFAVVFVPRSPLKLAALTAMLIAGFQLVLTHWFYLYLPWFFPFVALALLGVTARKPELLVALALALALFLASWLLLHVGFYERDQIVDACVREVRERHRGRAGSLPRLRGRVPAGRSSCLRAARDRRYGLPEAFEWLMALCGAAVLAVALAARKLGLGVAAASLAARDRVGDPDALRSLARDARRVRARGARRGAAAARAWNCSARPLP